MPTPPRRLPEIAQAIVAARGWRVSTSSPGVRAAPDQSQLVFVGNWQDPCPRRLLFDADLEPVDIVTWQVIRVHADASKIVAFPSYADLMRTVRVSRATVARALAVLRLTGWLPLCAALRDADGRFAGHVYALNDERLPMPEILAIDEGYVRFTEQAQAHRSAHVRGLARDALIRIQNAATAPAGTGLDPVPVREHLAHRLDEMLQLVGNRVQNPNAAHRVQNLNSVLGSSSVHKNTTTKNVARSSANVSADSNAKPPLPEPIFPEGLSLTDSQRRVLVLRFEHIPANQRQDILDEAAGRVLAKRKTKDPVRCEFDYVARLCTRALEGQFVFTDAGERIRRAREERGMAEQRLQRAKDYSEARRLEELAKHQARTK